MKWNLNVEVEQKETFKKLHHQDKLLFFGSCFSQNISNILSKLKFSVVQNPFGILYNPKSIAMALHYVVKKKEYQEQELFSYNDLFHSFDHHSSYSNFNASSALEEINSSIAIAHNQLVNAHSLIITFGTAFFYQLKENKRVVGNCHKLPASSFEKIRDNSQEIVANYIELFSLLKSLNPKLQIIFTVSPIRHWKNGAADNNWSKSILIDSVRTLAEKNEFVHYFPSFEILMDELRDYRFYEEDLIHPNSQAVHHIWEKFKSACISDSQYELISEIEMLMKACQHKPFNFEHPKHQKFIASTQQKIENLQSKYPYVDFSEELILLNRHK